MIGRRFPSASRMRETGSRLCSPIASACQPSQGLKPFVRPGERPCRDKHPKLLGRFARHFSSPPRIPQGTREPGSLLGPFQLERVCNTSYCTARTQMPAGWCLACSTGARPTVMSGRRTHCSTLVSQVPVPGRGRTLDRNKSKESNHHGQYLW